MEPQPSHSLSGRTILQVLPALETGGVERGTIEMAAAITAAGGRALVASAGGGMERDLARVGGIHIPLPLEKRDPGSILMNSGRLRKLIGREKVDLVHARSRAPAWSALYATRRTGTPLVTTFHGTYGAKNFLKRRYNAVMTAGDRVIAISDFIANHIQTLYPLDPDRLRIIPRGVDTDRFDPDLVSARRLIALSQQWRLPDGARTVMLPGRLTRWKGQIPFIEAAAELDREDLKWLIVGDDQGRSAYRRELESLIKKRGLQDRVWLMGPCKDMDVAYLLADVVVSASLEPEAFGRVAIEAQAMGRAVIATDHGGAQETVIPGKTGTLVPPHDVGALAEAVAAAIDLPPDARALLAENARTHVQQNYTTALMCARTINVYAELL
ncbi:MAG: glycosyltransferase family 4 protein [Magnetospiraceae bacterium]